MKLIRIYLIFWRNFNLLFFLSLVFVLSCCKENPDPPCDDNGLPCLTHEGKNTFGCRIDGAIFIPKTSTSIGGAVAISPSYNESTKKFTLGVNREDPEEHIENLLITLIIDDGIGVYNIDVTGSTLTGYIYYGKDECTYYHDPDNKGTVNITFFDETQRIVAGTFSMTLINNDCSDGTTMNITDGRFDIRF